MINCGNYQTGGAVEELKRLRTSKGWSQQKLADESGVDRATINQVEGGRRSPTIATLENLAQAMDVEVADFFPKAQSPLPLPDFTVQRQGADEGQEDNAPLYNAYEALGRALALAWKDALREWNEKYPPKGETPSVFDFGRLLEWVIELAHIVRIYRIVATESGYAQREEYEDTLRLMEDARRGAAEKFKELFEPLKTDSEFRKIIKANDLEAILSDVE
jgi:transcriptional regulator with XRE-family HTH domain